MHIWWNYFIGFSAMERKNSSNWCSSQKKGNDHALFTGNWENKLIICDTQLKMTHQNLIEFNCHEWSAFVYLKLRGKTEVNQLLFFLFSQWCRPFNRDMLWQQDSHMLCHRGPSQFTSWPFKQIQGVQYHWSWMEL